MCSPAAAGLALAVYASEQQAKTGEEQLKFAAAGQAQTAVQLDAQAEQFLKAADLADLKAIGAAKRGAIDEAVFRREGKSFAGSQRADLAGSGAEISSGTAVDIQTDTAAAIETDALTVRFNSDLETFGFRQEASDFRFKSALTKQQAQFARQAQKKLSKAGRRVGRSGVFSQLTRGFAS